MPLARAKGSDLSSQVYLIEAKEPGQLLWSNFRYCYQLIVPAAILILRAHPYIGLRVPANTCQARRLLATRLNRMYTLSPKR